MAEVLHVKGEVLVSEQESVPELWIIDGKISFLSLIHISEPTRRHHVSRMPSSA